MAVDRATQGNTGNLGSNIVQVVQPIFAGCIVYTAIDQEDVDGSSGLTPAQRAASPRDYAASDPSALTGQVPGSVVRGFGATAGELYIADDSGAMVKFLDDGALVAPVSTSLLLVGDGAVGAPSISFSNSPTTGLYRSAADTIGIAVAGALDFTIAANTFTAASGSTIATNTIAETTAAAGVTVDGCLIKDGRAALLATAAMFTSTEQTGTGAPQNIAHGFGSTPSMYWWVPSDVTAGFVVSSPSAGSTNITLTVTSGAKFYVYALK